MTDALLRCFIKNADDTDDPKVRNAYGRFAGGMGIFCNLVLFTAKLFIGFFSGSISIMADAVNNLSDAASSIVTLIGFWLSAKPPDEHHPYGHARYEYISGIVVAGLVLVIGFRFAESAIRKILHPAPVGISRMLVAVLALSILLKLWMSLFYRSMSKKINSASLKATAQDSMNDVMTTTMVLVCAGIEHFTGLMIDGYAGLIVAAVILFGCIGIVGETVSPLIGESTDPELMKLYGAEIENADPRILGIHDLMVHDYGPGRRYATVHVEIDAKEDVLATHELIDSIEKSFWQHHRIELLIHHDPVDLADPERNRLRKLVKTELLDMDPGLRIHDFRLERKEEGEELVFDMVVPPTLLGWEEEIEAQLKRMLEQEAENRYRLKITFDTQSFNRF